MLRSSLVRRVRFRARHHYWNSSWSESRNHAVFGEQVHPHEHEFTLEVAVSGPVDPSTGFVMELGALDRLLQEKVLGSLADGDLNESVPEVKAGAMQPSTEALSQWIWERITERLPGSVRLVRVSLFESDSLGSEIESDPASAPAPPPPGSIS